MLRAGDAEDAIEGDGRDDIERERERTEVDGVAQLVERWKCQFAATGRGTEREVQDPKSRRISPSADPISTPLEARPWLVYPDGAGGNGIGRTPQRPVCRWMRLQLLA